MFATHLFCFPESCELYRLVGSNYLVVEMSRVRRDAWMLGTLALTCNRGALLYPLLDLCPNDRIL
jgi:hypothetical protein